MRSFVTVTTVNLNSLIHLPFILYIYINIYFSSFSNRAPVYSFRGCNQSR